MIENKEIVVAEGTVHPKLSLDHHSNILPGHMKVSVDNYNYAYSDLPVPVPSKFIQILVHAHGTFTQWPKNLIRLTTSQVNTIKLYKLKILISCYVNMNGCTVEFRTRLKGLPPFLLLAQRQLSPRRILCL